MCTGSGCIAISLKKMLNASITGIDISIDAIKLAKAKCFK
jgi:Methylase of polypeptide chain release factors